MRTHMYSHVHSFVVRTPKEEDVIEEGDSISFWLLS